MLFCTMVHFHTIRDMVFSAGTHRLQIYHSSSLFLCSSNSAECSQHDPTLNLYYAEILSRSYTPSKYRPKYMKNDSFSSEVLLQSPCALSLLLQTAGFWTNIPENKKKIVQNFTINYRTNALDLSMSSLLALSVLWQASSYLLFSQT